MALAAALFISGAPQGGSPTVPGIQDPGASRPRILLEEAKADRDPAAKRAKVAEAVEALLSRDRGAVSPSDIPLLAELGRFAQEVGDLDVAIQARRKVLDIQSQILPDDDRELQRARQGLAAAMRARGHLQDALSLYAKVVEVFSRTLPPDHRDLQRARGNLAVSLQSVGDFPGARSLLQEVLEVQERTLPPDDPDLQRTRGNLASTLLTLGEPSDARVLADKVLDVFSRTRPDDDPELQIARRGVANIAIAQGQLELARTLQTKALEVAQQAYPDDHPDLQSARADLATTLNYLGDLPGARVLQEKVLEIDSRTLPEGSPILQRARGNLAKTLHDVGDFEAARALEDEVLDVFSRTLPEDSPDLQKARLNLAGTLSCLGDMQAARALQEKVLEVDSRTMPERSPDLQWARSMLATTLDALHDHKGARQLQERVLEVLSETLSADDTDLQVALGSLAATLHAEGEFERARALRERVLQTFLRTLPENHPNVQWARQSLAATMEAQGDLAGAQSLLQSVVDVDEATLPEGHPELVRARENLAVAVAEQSACNHARSRGPQEVPGENADGREKCLALLRTACRSQARSVREVLLQSSSREAEERCASMAETLDHAISFSAGYGVYGPMPELVRESFLLSETTRGAALGSAALMRVAGRSPEVRELRAALSRASDELATQAQKGTTSDAFQTALTNRDRIERDLVHRTASGSGAPPIAFDMDLPALAASLTNGDAMVAVRRYTRRAVEAGDDRDSVGKPRLAESKVESLCAFVLRHRSTGGSGPESAQAIGQENDAIQLSRVDLGSLAPIEAAVRDWRNDLGVADDSRGVSASRPPSATPSGDEDAVRLRRLIIDPLLASLEGAHHILFALDDVLHLVPLDALPADEAPSSVQDTPPRLGDCWHIETRVTLSELLSPSSAGQEVPSLLAIGDVAYDALDGPSNPASAPSPITTAVAEQAADDTAARTAPVTSLRKVDEAGPLRGGAWSAGFVDIPGTEGEVRGIAEQFGKQFAAPEALTLLTRTAATREKLLELAPRSSWIHIATHGWFAPESIRSWADAGPIDSKSGLGIRSSGVEQVKHMSPMLLCGLALAGASLPQGSMGRIPGLVTAEELSTLELTHCDLVVLSACDTNVGERRAGQGVASLQKALQMAGARSVITSLWKVPDEVTKDLMLDFYRRLWVEKKPKWQALWEAKTKIRNAKDESGKPKYTTRDWAAWVLTGDPN